MTKFLVAVDGSNASYRAAKYALDRLVKKGDTVFAVHVINPRQFTIPYGPPSMDLKEKCVEESEKFVEKVCSMIESDEIDCNKKILDGIAAIELKNFAESSNCDFVVVGTTGRSRIKEYFLGSTAKKLISIMDIPVIVVP